MCRNQTGTGAATWRRIPHASRITSTWAVLLAGGEGTRLQSLTNKIAGDSRPKQFCCLLEDKSLLRQTLQRIAPVFSEDHTMFVVTQAHERWYREDLRQARESNIVAQPCNRGTGIAAAFALLQILARDSDAIVAFFPCDHYYSDNEAFVKIIKSGLTLAEEHAASIILLGAEASSPEVEYGWIEPGPGVQNESNTRLLRVNRFWEKPTPSTAVALLRQGCLWNTFVTLGSADTFLELLCSEVPRAVVDLSESLAQDDGQAAYEKILSLDLSRDILAKQVHRLLVIPDGSSGWVDLGNPSRRIDTLRRNRIEPEWMNKLNELNKIGTPDVSENTAGVAPELG
jgi:mannose-1-phosphate guanylyltransferase